MSVLNTLAVVALTSWLAAVSSSSKADTLSSDTRSLSRTWKAKQTNTFYQLCESLCDNLHMALLVATSKNQNQWMIPAKYLVLSLQFLKLLTQTCVISMYLYKQMPNMTLSQWFSLIKVQIFDLKNWKLKIHVVDLPSHQGLCGVQTRTWVLWGLQLHWRLQTETEPAAWPLSSSVTARVGTRGTPDVPTVAGRTKRRDHCYHLRWILHRDVQWGAGQTQALCRACQWDVNNLILF